MFRILHSLPLTMSEKVKMENHVRFKPAKGLDNTNHQYRLDAVDDMAGTKRNDGEMPTPAGE
jgi:hypothetical protein